MVAIPPDHIADILQEPFAENAARAELPAWHRLNQDQALPVALVEERGGLRVVREPHRIDPHAFEQACLPALRLIGGGQPDIWILLVAVDAPELERLSVERKSLLRDLGETDARRFLIGIFLAVFIGYTAGQGIQSRVIRAPQAGVLDVENRREAGASAGRHPASPRSMPTVAPFSSKSMSATGTLLACAVRLPTVACTNTAATRSSAHRVSASSPPACGRSACTASVKYTFGVMISATSRYNPP